jgi:hypothetical protein
MRYNRQKWQARAVVPSALQDLQGFEVEGTWNVPNSPPWKAVSDESHLSMIGARNARVTSTLNARVTSTLSGHSPLVRALHVRNFSAKCRFQQHSWRPGWVEET